jgi:hypothetical protein
MRRARDPVLSRIIHVTRAQFQAIIRLGYACPVSWDGTSYDEARYMRGLREILGALTVAVLMEPHPCLGDLPEVRVVVPSWGRAKP